MKIDTPTNQITVILTEEMRGGEEDYGNLYDDTMLMDEIVTIVEDDTEMGGTLREELLANPEIQ